MSLQLAKPSLALALVALFGCPKPDPADPPAPVARPSKTAVTPMVDHPWSDEHQQAHVEFEAAWAAFQPPMAPMEMGAAAASEPAASDDDDYLLKIYVFDLGQADSLLAIGPPPEQKTLLIDLGHPTKDSKLPAGFKSSAGHVSQRLLDLTGKTAVDYFVLSHYHSDHAGYGAAEAQGWGTGIIGLLSDFKKSFSVDRFIHIGDDGADYMKDESDRGVYTTIQKRMPTWKKYKRVVDSEPPEFGTEQIDLGTGVSVDILSFAGKVPSGDSAFEDVEDLGIDYGTTPGNENDLSIALEISAGEFEFFTAGDLNGTNNPKKSPLYVLRKFGEVYTNIERHMVSYWQDKGRENDVEIYRANHHGSSYSTTQQLLDTLDPEFILYSTGADSGHPGRTVIERGGRTARQLATTYVNNYDTFINSKGQQVGEIEIVVAEDGASYTINGERHLTFSSTEEKAGDDVDEEDQTH